MQYRDFKFKNITNLYTSIFLNVLIPILTCRIYSSHDVLYFSRTNVSLGICGVQSTWWIRRINNRDIISKIEEEIIYICPVEIEIRLSTTQDRLQRRVSQIIFTMTSIIASCHVMLYYIGSNKFSVSQWLITCLFPKIYPHYLSIILENILAT